MTISAENYQKLERKHVLGQQPRLPPCQQQHSALNEDHSKDTHMHALLLQTVSKNQFIYQYINEFTNVDQSKISDHRLKN